MGNSNSKKTDECCFAEFPTAQRRLPVFEEVNDEPTPPGDTSCLLRSRSTSYSKLLFQSSLEYTPGERLLSDERTTKSDLTAGVPIWIVTTAALPWMTGTAVNPLLRAAYLAKQQQHVHLVLPWLERAEDRVCLYGERWRDVSVEYQEEFIKTWIQTNVGEDTILQMHWYPARYHSALGSIFAMGDVCATLVTEIDPQSICLLEEPEHLNYYRGGHWRTHFAHVCGIIHTNYEAYAEQKSTLAAPLIGAVSAWMVRAYCDKVIHLSATLPKYAPEKEVVSNVHGVRNEFFKTYKPGSGTQMYFLGKLLWAKGLDKILELQEVYKSTTGQYFEMDIYGSGPDEEEIRQAFARSTILTTYSDMAAAYWIGDSRRGSCETKMEVEPLPVQFRGRMDHAKLDDNHGGCYKIFVNPSVSEVLCTVTAEALAMGKFVVIPKHPSNTFFAQFQNCLMYNSPAEFCQQLQYAQSNEPVVLPDLTALTWEAATERLIKAASVSYREAARLERLFAIRDQRLADLHIKMYVSGGIS